jgi:type IV secretion system protein VirB1
MAGVSPMSALAITSALIALSGQCAATVAPGTTLSFARAESDLDPLAIHDNADGRSYHPVSKAEAVATASRLIAAGHSIDAGFMQVNSLNFGWLGLSVSNAFELCPSIQAGARVLHTGYDPCMDAGGEAQACLRIAASTYNTGSPTRGFANGYVMRIAATAAHVIPEIRVAGTAPQTQPQAAPAIRPQPLEPGEPPRWDMWAHRAWLENKAAEASAPAQSGLAEVVIHETSQQGSDQ